MVTGDCKKIKNKKNYVFFLLSDGSKINKDISFILQLCTEKVHCDMMRLHGAGLAETIQSLCHTARLVQ